MELKKELASGPFMKQGFSDELRRRIETQVDKKKTIARPWWPAISGVCAIILIIAIFSMFGDQFASQESALTEKVSKTASDAKEALADQEVQLSSAVLIGFRADEQAEGTHSYRTVLAAPIDGKLQAAAEGTGILVPYKQEFWKIEPMVKTTETSSFSYLTIHPAKQALKTAAFKEDSKAKVTYSEKLMYAGNKYVAVENNETVASGDSTNRYNRLWVREFKQMNGGKRTLVSEGSADAQHMTIGEVLGNDAEQWIERERNTGKQPSGNAGLSNDNWWIVRDNGKWVAQIAEANEGTGQDGSTYFMRNVPFEVPDSIVSFDHLCCTLKEVQTVQPAAVDAFSSPKSDMIAVVTDRQIIFYPYSNQIINKPLLTVDRADNEQIVMMQWATDKYIQKWVDQAQMYLQAPAAEMVQQKADAAK